MNHRLLAWILGCLCVVPLLLLSIHQRTSVPPVILSPQYGIELDSLPQHTHQAKTVAAVDYNRDILPILSGKCFACHGPASNARKGGLRLDKRDSATKPTRSGDTPIKPGKSSESEVVRRIFAQDADERMPPIKGGSALTEPEEELIKRWIDQGAPYQMHWAFVKPARPAVPKVKNRSWVKNEIDAFILHRLEQEGLPPSPPADRVTLIRRLSLDLRGLPPSLQEVDAFLADTSPDAYEKLVDQMLASPRYGEKMALTWLDLARFGDTSGY